MKDKLTHLDARGRARMVDVGGKEITHRVCVARCEVHMAPETLARIVEGDTAKGDVLAIARIAAIQAAIHRKLAQVEEVFEGITA